MSVEQEVKDYKPKHQQQIFLDSRPGSIRNDIGVNLPIADGFMRVSDMRRDIVITSPQKKEVADKELEIRKGEKTWYVVINDKLIPQNGEFTTAFKKKVDQGLSGCLKREKLLNSGEGNFAFFNSYAYFLLGDLGLIPFIGLYTLANCPDPDRIPLAVFNTLGYYYLVQEVGNTVNLALSLLGETSKRLTEGLTQKGIKPSIAPEFREPFVKNSMVEIFAPFPTVPIDRYIRGTIYLKKHGDQILKQK